MEVFGTKINKAESMLTSLERLPALLKVSPTSSGVEMGKPTHFTVNTKPAGKAKLDVQFTGPAKGDAVRDSEIIDHHDNTYTVRYTPVQQVSYEKERVIF